MTDFQLRANVLRLRLCDPSKPTGSIYRIDYRRSADTLRRSSFDGGPHINDAHSIEHSDAPLGE